jgi:hypothetical protein
MHHHSAAPLNQGFEDKTGAIIVLFAPVTHHNFLVLPLWALE